MFLRLDQRILRPVQMILAAFLIYAVGVQCCQGLATLANEVNTQAQPNCHLVLEHSKAQDKQDTNDCHCEYNPSQLSWNGNEKVVLKPLQLKLVSYTLLLESHPLAPMPHDMHRQKTAARPPPQTTPLFIKSTILLI